MLNIQMEQAIEILLGGKQGPVAEYNCFVINIKFADGRSGNARRWSLVTRNNVPTTAPGAYVYIMYASSDDGGCPKSLVPTYILVWKISPGHIQSNK